MSIAFEPFDLAGRRLSNRIVMAPMTRSRAYGPGQSATDLMATYYAQRAGAGLIITEGTQPSVEGQGYMDTPGIHTPEQIAAWRSVTTAVHDQGGAIYLQLLHTGRIGHPVITGRQPVAPSAIPAPGFTYTHEGPKDNVTPHELSDAEVLEVMDSFARAARNAITAGFDGVEIHGSNGYLIHQFLAPNSNQRTDSWGGSPARRARFAIEVARAAAEAIGPDKVGFRISPGNNLLGVEEEDPADRDETYAALVTGLAALDLAYLHQIEAPGTRELMHRLRKQLWPGIFILNPFTSSAPTGPDELKLIEDGTADMLAYGALFLANPDLPSRLQRGGPFNTADRSSYYGGDHRGYTDYPVLR
ncbi:N-ethylmaleimide reductase [Streptomyces sp. MBT84]|uniref:alkene reductase n=1 Tax=unclassified Streptomyces TaxID=2593676 RepID=UPI001C6DE297|nr:alkene reductase [Streptomyces sp. MBT84]MBW8705711.1 N-ethylmaleimide reductase [Streptomyces sp. MBT84]